ncbi:hypothetical protein B0I37DRAFT_56413 [Chaetomium sp. MPI-CAGE-AT-0009]|nr:hypothetical protein B0I37DRAFT_56413 [Chaetomium sp. MPI-CAGE-AT-0009]
MPYPFPKDDSFEESSDSLIEHVPHLKKRADRICHRSLLLISLVAFAIAVAMIEMVVLETIFVHLSSHDQSPQLSSELNKLVPDCRLSSSICLFRASFEFDQCLHDETRDDWLSYFPRGNGFIAVNNTDNYTLPDPILFRGQNAYSIAVFHQLHCLYTIMDVYSDMSIPSGHRRRQHAHNHEHHSHQDEDQGNTHRHNHVDHCFRYLRQSLLCCGDTALEGQDPNANTLGTDGTGAVHVCKDYDAIRSWADGHRLVDSKHP